MVGSNPNVSTCMESTISNVEVQDLGANRYVFDMDGTLYNFDGKVGRSFGESTFYRDLKVRIANFVMQQLKVDEAGAEQLMRELREKYDDSISVGIEVEKGVSRYDYFAATWDVDPSRYIEADSRLQEVMSPLAGRALLLTAAPRVWASRVVEYLGLEEVFGDRFLTGEPDLRKPNPDVFARASEMLEVEPSRVVSIGDQIYSDIVPAKAVGMRTVLVGRQSIQADMSFESVIEAVNTLEGKQ